MKRTYTFYSDPAHGWLKVEKSELERLGIADKISPYSYEFGGFAYLEEDCDATAFVEAKERVDGLKQADLVFEDKFTNNTSRIRSYPSYYRPSPSEVLEAAKLRIKVLDFQNWNKSACRKIDRATLAELKFWVEHYGIKI